METKNGPEVYLVEIKSWSGTISGDASTWRREVDGREFLLDSPLLLANRKAKKLGSILKAQKALAKKRRPFIEAIVFLSRVGVRCWLKGLARTGVYLAARSEQNDHPSILDVLNGNAGFDPRRPPTRIDPSLSRAFGQAMRQAGIRPSQRQRRVADYRVRELLLETDTYQDWEAEHVSVPSSKRRIRIYRLRHASSESVRAERRRMAEREYELLDGITHDGILRVELLTTAEQGPALDRAPDDTLVATLATAEVRTSDVAMGQSVTSARSLTGALSPQGFQVFEKIGRLRDPYGERAQEIITALHDALRRDEHVPPLDNSLQHCQARALDLLAEAATKPVPTPPEPPPRSQDRETDPEKRARGETAGHHSVAPEDVGAVFAKIEGAVKKTGATRVEIEWKVFKDEDGPEGNS